MKTPGRWRLAAMMGSFYAVQGAFWPVLGVHLGELGIVGGWRGAVFASQAVAASLVPLAAGQLVDRWLPTQYVLATAYGLGTILLAILTTGLVTQPAAFVLISLAYWCLISPTNGLSASMTMRNLQDPKGEYASVRAWGTIGWMAIGWAVTGIMYLSPRTGGGMYEAFATATVLSLATSIYCLFLPPTPPLAGGPASRASLRKAMEVVHDSDVRAYLIASFLLFLTTPMIYQVIPGYLAARGLPRPMVATASSLSQVLELAALLSLPWLLNRLGVKRTMTLGLTAWFLRFATLALNPPLGVAVWGSLLHGIGYGCWTIGGQVFLDGRAPRAYRASVQALLIIVTTGLASLIGSVAAGYMVGTDQGAGNRLLFVVPAIIDGLALAYFVSAFRCRPAIEHAPASASSTDTVQVQTAVAGG